MIDLLRNGSWLTRERIRAVALMLAAGYALMIALMLATSDGRLDRAGRPLGTDFSQVWVAGKFVLEGHPETPFDPVPHEARQKREFSETSGFFHWGYPPYFLPVAALFALFPYLLGLALWQLSTLPLYLAAVARAAPRGIDPRDALLVALAYPAVFVNLTHGHNGFLSAALLGFGVILVRKRPWAAGLLFGLAAYKPQFGLIVPLALLAGRHFAAFVAASLAVAAMTLATTLWFGVDTWRAFIVSLDYSRTYVAEDGATGWQKIQSVFAAARFWGASLGLAYALHGLVALTAAAATLRLWFRHDDWRLSGAALLAASLIATPYVLDYDLMVLGPALALFIAHAADKGFQPWEKTALAAIWITPLLARNIASVTGVHIGVIALIAFMWLVWRRRGD